MKTTDPPSSGESVTLVACCGPKLDAATAAADLYISPLFKKSRIYAERRGRWFILSALHGLLEPDTVIEPYDKTLKGMTAIERREWGSRVHGQMEASGLLSVSLVALAGADYVKPLKAAGMTVAEPMKDMGIGRRLRWLNEQNG